MIIAGLLAVAAVIGAGVGGVAIARRRGASPSVSLPAPEEQDLGGSLHALAEQVRPDVPTAVVARVSHIADVVDDIEPRLDQMGFANVDAHAVVRTATSYVPEALEAYMRLPRTFADTRKIQGSKTALAVLCDQLDLLASKMDDVYDAVCRQDAQALVAHGQFLAARFGSGANALEPPTP